MNLDIKESIEFLVKIQIKKILKISSSKTWNKKEIDIPTNCTDENFKILIPHIHLYPRLLIDYISYNDTNKIKILISHNCPFSDSYYSDVDIIDWVCAYKNYEIFEILLSHNCHVRPTALIVVAENADFELLKFLLSKPNVMQQIREDPYINTNIKSAIRTIILDNDIATDIKLKLIDLIVDNFLY